MNTHEYAVILTSTMTEEELLNDKHIQDEDFRNDLLHWGETPKEESLRRAREELRDHIKFMNFAANVTNSKEPRFYQTEFFYEHYKKFAKCMQNFICPICKQPLIKKINRRTHKEIIGCTSYPDCKFIFDSNSFLDVLLYANQQGWIK